MAIRGASPARFTPRSVSDTLNAADSPPGACRSLSNLIFDPSTPHTFQCRPARTQLTNFPGISNPGVVSASMEVGSIVYGLIASSRNAGKDEPFAYDSSTNTFITVSGITGVKCPTTQSSSGDWVPPSMDMFGTMIVVTHPGFPGGGGPYFGWFDLTNPATPVWNAGNTATNALIAVPTFVKQFNNRAYFIVAGNNLPFTDALTNPPTITNASQVLFIGDSSKIYALSGLPLATTSGGILQCLLAFKNGSIAQVTGDPTTNNLAVNQLNTSSGTQCPRSVCQAPEGVFYVDDDGLRCVLYSGSITDPDPDIRVPFINALNKSRISSAYNEGVLRICLQNGAAFGQPYQEWWYDTVRDAFTGPHTMRQDLAIADHNGKYFFVFDSSHPGIMYESHPVQSSTSTFTEDGTLLSWVYQTSPIGESESLYANSSTETTVNIAFASGGQMYAITAQDESGGSLATAVIQAPQSGAVWSLFNWGAALWGAAQFGLRPVIIPWTNPLVFSKVVINIAGSSINNLKLGAIKINYKVLKYLLS